jgi:protein involved in polysaccharide export with SLBB domain
MKKVFLLFLVLSGFIIAQEEEQSSSKQKNPMMNQPITVMIGGDFIVTGSFTASKYQRLDHFITTIFTQAKLNTLSGLTEIETIKQFEKKINNYALRDITLKHADGSVQKIDLLKFRMTGDLKNSPYLLSDDAIIFPSYDEDKNVIDINGAINKPTKFQFVKGDKIADAILFAGGLNKDAYENISKAEISRLDGSGNKEELLTVGINDDFELKSGDRIRILADENQKGSYKVLVLGEVKYPGFIYVTREGLPLKQIIEKAGGFKENADLYRSEVIRNLNTNEILKKYKLTQDYINNSEKLISPDLQLSMRQQKNLLEMARLSNLIEEDTLFFNIDNQLRMLQSESLVDFTKLSNPNSDDSNFIVRDGDMVLVPDKFEYVYVFGQVPKAGYVKFQQGKDYKYYIEKSGGLGESAREDDEIVIIKGKGKDWVTKEKEKLNMEPGDYVYVPKEIPRNFWYSFSRVSSVIGVIGSVATIILLVAKF